MRSGFHASKFCSKISTKIKQKRARTEEKIYKKNAAHREAIFVVIIEWCCQEAFNPGGQKGEKGQLWKHIGEH